MKCEPQKDSKQDNSKIKFLLWKDNADSNKDCILETVLVRGSYYHHYNHYYHLHQLTTTTLHFQPYMTCRA